MWAIIGVFPGHEVYAWEHDRVLSRRLAREQWLEVFNHVFFKN